VATVDFAAAEPRPEIGGSASKKNRILALLDGRGIVTGRTKQAATTSAIGKRPNAHLMIG
jgi:hypothetical protein